MATSLKQLKLLLKKATQMDCHQSHRQQVRWQRKLLQLKVVPKYFYQFSTLYSHQVKLEIWLCKGLHLAWTPHMTDNWQLLTTWNSRIPLDVLFCMNFTKYGLKRHQYTPKQTQTLTVDMIVIPFILHWGCSYVDNSCSIEPREWT